MGMQIASLTIGSAVAAPQEFPQEKRSPPAEGQKLPLEQKEITFLGSGDAKAPDIRQTAADLAHITLAFDRRLKFEIDQDSREIRIKVIDNETDKVIKVLPPEELQRLHSRISETIGFLFDKMV